MSVLHLTDATFKKEALESNLPVLVDFWAPWCGPCKMIAPVIEELAKEYDKKIKFCKINIDNDAKVAAQFGVMSIPTLIFFKNGKAADQAVGALNKVQLKKKIDSVLL